MQRGTLLAQANEVRMVCNGEHRLHWLKLFYLWKYVHLYFENICPFQNSAYEVCLMERWSSKPGKHINQLECLLWNSIRSSFWYFISYVGVLPEWRAGMGQTSTSNVTRHYQGATLWDKGNSKWAPLLIDELAQY